MLGDLESKVSEGSEGEIGQVVVRTDSGGGSGSDSESLKRSANVGLLIDRDDMGNSMMMAKEGKQLEMTIGESSEMMRMMRRGLRERVL